jgi:hypothetical protein
MVAAWMRADTGVGPSIASGNQGLQRELADLPHAPSSSSNPMARTTLPDSLPTLAKTWSKLTEPISGEHQEDGDREAGVTDPVHQERLLAGGGRGRPGVPERDQQVARRGRTPSQPKYSIT